MTTGTQHLCFIVDDDPDLRRVIAHSVTRAGMPSVECGSLNEFVATMREIRPELVFLDVGLADGGAVDVLDVLADSQSDALVQLVSGRSSDELRQLADEGEERGIRMLPALTKPFRAGAIRDVVARLMEGTR
jgi:DNA-binding response OmpR family regulator